MQDGRGHGARRCGLILLLCAGVLAAAACGGAGGGSGGGNLTLIRFSLDDIDNVPLNRRLVWHFSTDVEASTVGAGSIQIREGSAFGRTVQGAFVVEGAEVHFLPELPVTCDFDAPGYGGLRPNTEYRVTVAGHPEEFIVRAQGTGRSMPHTQSFGFRTRAEADPGVFEDVLAGKPPEILSSSHPDGSAAVAVHEGNAVQLVLSENLDPCSVHAESVRFYVYELGDPETRVPANEGRVSGFDPVEDDDPDPYRWGSRAPTTRLGEPQRIPAEIALFQDFTRTEITIRPIGGRFPENALIVVELTSDIEDFGGSRFIPRVNAFTTENLPEQERRRTIEFEGETPIREAGTTADVDTTRSPGRAQGWLSVTGDGDNGAETTRPSSPAPCFGQDNDAVLDHFDPATDVILDTGAAPNTCPNEVDGSRAVVWEFQSFRLRSGVTLRFVGVNPAILLVRGDGTIEANATVLVRGHDRGQESPVGDGEWWKWSNKGAPSPVTAPGGVGVAGGGNGGDSICGAYVYGYDGTAGFGSSDAGVVGGHGAGRGGVALDKFEDPTNGGCAGGGGGGGHAREGKDGLTGTSPYAAFKDEPRSDGGARYWSGGSQSRMLQPSAGSGGGGGGWLHHHLAGAGEGPSGGGGGAGGGYLALVCGGDLTIAGTIDAAGGRGGRAVGIWRGRQYLARSGGGGGGAGGGILLMTPRDLQVAPSAVITTAGGAGGLTGTAQPPPPYNHGGDGSTGRLVMEDGDGLVPGSGAATLVPGEGSVGFYRGAFDEQRFVGGRYTQALTEPFYVGSLRPRYLAPATEDLLAGIPKKAEPGSGATAILVEVRGYPLRPNGSLDASGASPWHTVGYFEGSLDPGAPLWHEGVEPSDIPRPDDNAGPGLASLNVPGGMPFLQVRVSFFLGANAEAADAGAFLDRWHIRFVEDL